MTPSDQEEAERRYPAPRTDITDVQRAAFIAGREDERASTADTIAELRREAAADADYLVKRMQNVERALDETQYLLKRMEEAHARAPDWEKLWEEQSNRAEAAERALAEAHAASPVAGVERRRAEIAIAALRTPDASLARVPNTVRQSIADVIEELLAPPPVPPMEEST